jgi:hypothetical protein
VVEDRPEDGRAAPRLHRPGLDTRFLGDLYQDLSEHAKKTYALLQTPEFVEEFILDRTLDPAIETFGLDEVRMIDPTCGSGHFLLGAFERLLDRGAEREPGRRSASCAAGSRRRHGVDLNPFAVAIARFRLSWQRCEASGSATCGCSGLSAEPRGRAIRCCTGDERALLKGLKGSRLADAAPVPDRGRGGGEPDPGGRALSRVVGNPPYITVKDPAATDRVPGDVPTATGSTRSPSRSPSASSIWRTANNPHGSAGFVGMITANSFMKRSSARSSSRSTCPKWI